MLNRTILSSATVLLLMILSFSFTFTNATAYPISSRGATPNNVKSAYQVFGKHYQLLKSSKNYNERGIASWYGSAFHRKHTASGERYNMFALTAAHKSLPLRTYVKVTNLINGREVIVKVNDRGPFVGKRLIDLSYAAAEKLGMIGRGLAPVQIKALS